jgi:hypothetical protein
MATRILSSAARLELGGLRSLRRFLFPIPAARMGVFVVYALYQACRMHLQSHVARDKEAGPIVRMIEGRIL